MMNLSSGEKKLNLTNEAGQHFVVFYDVEDRLLNEEVDDEE